MTLSPFEIERQEFGRSPFGYKRAEVDGFLDEVRGSFIGLWQERSDLREEVERLTERVARFTALEEQLKNTLLLATDSAEKACEQAKRESELVMREAGQKAREIVHSAHEEKQRLAGALRDLQAAEGETRQRFRALAQAVLTHLDDGEQQPVDQVASSLRAAVAGTTGSMPAVGRLQQSQQGGTSQRADAQLRPTSAPAAGRSRPTTTGEAGTFEPPPAFDASSFSPPRRTKIVEQPNGPAAAAQQAGTPTTSAPTGK